MRQPYQNTWPGGGEGTETPVPTMWPSIYSSPVSQLSWLKALSEDFFAVFELVASAFLRATSGAPSRAAQFDLLVLKGI